MYNIKVDEIKANPNLDLSERIKKHDNEADALISIMVDYNFWVNNRENISESTDKLLGQILNGHILDDAEKFEMVCNDPEKVDKYRKYFNIKKRISDNNGITQDDFDYLCGVIGFDDEMEKAVEEDFKLKGLIIEEYKPEEKNRHVK